MKMKEITVDYDKDADVLYLSFGEPKAAITEEIGNVGMRLDEKTHEIVGVTIIQFLKTFSEKRPPISVSVPRLLHAAHIQTA